MSHRRSRPPRTVERQRQALFLAGAGALVVAAAIATIVFVATSGGTAPSGPVMEPVAGAHSLGSADAPVTVMEFADFQ